MNTHDSAVLDRATLALDPRNITHQPVADEVNRRARAIAQRTLKATGGRAVYNWENEDIRLEYQGDFVDSEGVTRYGQTTRSYNVNGRWTPTSPLKSESGTGLINLGWQHFEGCEDEVVAAKLEIWHLLASPSLRLVPFVANHYAAKHPMSGNVRERLIIRLDEILEQLVLSNPATQDLSDTTRAAGGLDLYELEDTNAVGWAVKALEGSIPNTLRRIHHNEPALSSWDEVPDEENPSSLGITQLNLGAEHFGLAADEQLEADELEALGNEYAEVAKRKQGHKKDLYAATTLQRAMDFPELQVPGIAVRKGLLASLDEDDTLPLRSLKAYYDLVDGTPTPDQLTIDDAWLRIWSSWTGEQAFRLLALARAHEDAPGLLVRAAVGFADPMTEAGKTSIRRALSRHVRGDAVWRVHATEVASAYSNLRAYGDEKAWCEAAAAFVAHPPTPFNSATELLGFIDSLVEG